MDADLPLSADFDPPSPEAWRTLVEQTLKGGSPDRLAFKSYDGLRTEALYVAADSAPAQPDAARFGAVRSQGAGRWDVRTIVDHPDPAAANLEALRDLENGANSLLLRLDPAGRDGVSATSPLDLGRVLAGVEIELAPVALDAGWLAPQAADWLHAVARSAPRAKLAFHFDPITVFAGTGASPGPVASQIQACAEQGVRHAATYPDASLFLATGRAVHEAGGTESLELAVMAAAAATYARALSQAGLTPGEAFARIVVGLSADGEYFTTLAKFRAARAIWVRLTAAAGVVTPARIEARASRRMLSKLDPWVNLLRLTSAGFGAAVGGADAIVLEPFTQPIYAASGGRADAFARRQARNAQIVLMEESGLARVADPAGGAWFLETQTDQMARAGWAAFQEIERQGGIVAALENGWIARATAEARDARARDIATRKTGLIGVSAFPNLAEAGVAVEAVDPTPFAKPAPDVRQPGPDSACPPLAPWRAAQAYEALRAAAGRTAMRPKAYLATLGAAIDHAARVGFVRNLLAAGGIAAQTGEVGDYTPADGALVVLCGSDAHYADQAAEAVRQLKSAGAKALYLAGKPGELDAPLREAGLDGFLAAGDDAVATLARLLSEAGAAA